MRWFISLAGTFVFWMGLISGFQAMDANIEALQHKVALIHKILKNHVPNPMDKSDDELHEEITANIAELWAKYDAALQIHVDHLLRQFLPYVLEVANTDLQVDCIRSLLRVVRGLKTLDTWAFQRKCACSSIRYGLVIFKASCRDRCKSCFMNIIIY